MNDDEIMFFGDLSIQACMTSIFSPSRLGGAVFERLGLAILSEDTNILYKSLIVFLDGALFTFLFNVKSYLTIFGTLILIINIVLPFSLNIILYSFFVNVWCSS